METKEPIKHFRDLIVYRRAFDIAMKIYNINSETFIELDSDYEQIIAMLNSIEMNSQKFCF